MLLDFSVSNFRVFGEEVCLDLTRKSLKTLQPKKGATWIDSTWRTAAIYGPNASGKSTLLDAIFALASAVKGQRGSLYQPHTLSPHYQGLPTIFTIGFTLRNRRFQYEVEAYSWGIAREELWEAGGRWKKLFIRTQSDEGGELLIETGSSLKGPTAEVRRITTSNDLFLGMALKYEHSGLKDIASALLSIRFIRHNDQERDSRLRWLMAQVAETPESWHRISDLIANVADLGISRVELEEKDLPAHFTEKLRERLSQNDTGLEGNIDIPEEFLRIIRRSLLFYHRGADGKETPLGLDAQSQGTLTWLATIAPAIDALREGYTLFIDELDASLHPALTATMVELFKDPEVNPLGAQLIFSTHDTSLLDNSPQQLLEDSEVWLCEKSAQGTSELFSLADFQDIRKGTNKQRRYLLGTFGAIPTVDKSAIIRLLGYQ
ncbi:MAG: ATP-binding protein [Actinomycetaceae bacterium]|nr:ATP-binding protein [Actinomycetaceae bacterium]